jgi:phage baseplate assembly protein W
MSRVFSQEDGNLQVQPVNTSRSVSYKDIDLTFAAKASGDVFKKNDAAAVKQSVKNLILTNFGEKPFRFNYGGNLNSLLFELNDLEPYEVRDYIITAVENYEPRAVVVDVDYKSLPDQNSVNLLIKFQVINIAETQELNITLTRLR